MTWTCSTASARPGCSRDGAAGRRAALRRARLDLPARRRGALAGARRRRAARQLRAARRGVRRRRASTAGALCARARRGARSSSACAAPRRPGNLQAWARDVRYAARRELRWPPTAPAGGRPHGHRPGRDRPLPAGRLARAPRAARDGRARTGRSCGRCSAVTREETRGVLPRARAGLARGRDQRRPRLRARARPRRPLPALQAVAPGRRAQRRAHRGAAARGGRGARRGRRHGAGRPRPHRRWPTWRRCRARWGGSSCGGWPRTRPAALCPRAGAGWTRSSRSATTALLDLGDGARAVVAGGVLRVEPTPPLGPKR